MEVLTLRVTGTSRKIVMSTSNILTWNEQATMFFDFLMAQGFVLSEQDMADHFSELAHNMKNYRGNINEKTGE